MADVLRLRYEGTVAARIRSHHGATFPPRILHLVHDLVIQTSACNLRCKYCLQQESPFRQAPRSPPVYARGQPFKETLDAVLTHYDEVFDAPILKISGGEALLLSGLPALVGHALRTYESVQILTNGTLLSNRLLRSLADRRGTHLQISLDGHLFDMNRLRLRSQPEHDTLMQNLRRADGAGLPVEIFCVLHRHNIERIDSFGDYLLREFDGRVGLTPYPVRGVTSPKFAPEPSQQLGLARMIEAFERYEAILPPRPYMVDLYDRMFPNRARAVRCVVPWIMLQSFDSGRVTPCPYSWVEDLGSLASSDEARATGAAFGSTPGYRVRAAVPPRAFFCRHCITDGYVYSLFFDNQVTLRDLCHNRPILARPRAHARLAQLKHAWDELANSALERST